MISVQQVSKSYGKHLAIRDITFKVETGQVYGLLGYNGAGKTTLLKILSGAYRADSGFVSVDGVDVCQRNVPAKTPFIVADEPYFSPQSTPAVMRDFYAGYYPNWSDATFDGLLNLFGLERSVRIASFSKGMKRQVAILLGLSSGAPCLLLDESFDGLDLGKRIMLKTLLGRYARERGASVVLSSHNLKELEEVADRLGMIEGTRLAFDADVADLHAAYRKYAAPVSGDGRGVAVALAKAVSAAGGEVRWSRLERDAAANSSRIVFTSRGDGEAVQRAAEGVEGVGAVHAEQATLEEIFLRQEEVDGIGAESVLF